MIKSILYTVATLTFLGVANSRKQIGSCENPELTKDFNQKKYMGKWYEILRDSKIGDDDEN